MNDKSFNLHGTAIRINELGIFCVGPSGSGKSELAFSLIVEAKRWGASAALISDDQTMISIQDQHIIAHRPASIAGLIELRGSGVIAIASEPNVRLTHAVTCMSAEGHERLPPENERFFCSEEHCLPLIRIPAHSLTPYAKFSAFVGDLCRHGTFAP